MLEHLEDDPAPVERDCRGIVLQQAIRGTAGLTPAGKEWRRKAGRAEESGTGPLAEESGTGPLAESGTSGKRDGSAIGNMGKQKSRLT